jgi:hypothetical protein
MVDDFIGGMGLGIIVTIILTGLFLDKLGKSKRECEEMYNVHSCVRVYVPR